MPTAGELKQRITIEQKNLTGTGDRGQPVFTWETFKPNVPAKVEQLTGRKLELARQLVASASHEVTIRYLAGLDPTMRVNFGGLILNIGNLSDKLSMHFEIKITCIQQASGAT